MSCIVPKTACSAFWLMAMVAVGAMMPGRLWGVDDAFDDAAFEESGFVREAALEEDFFQAVGLLNGGKVGEAVKALKDLAVAGHAKSQYMLGVFYRYGQGVRQSDKRSVQWLKLAAEQRYPLAMLGYAEACIEGLGTRKDLKLARELLEPVAALEWGFAISVEDFGMVRAARASACYYLGTLLASGQGGPEDKERALALLRRAADTGSFEAAVYLAMEYAKGGLVSRDLAEARRYFGLVRLKASDQAFRRFKGLAVEHVDPVAKAALEKAAASVSEYLNKELNALLRNMGEAMLEEGSELYDAGFAAGLLELAAEGGDAGAQAIFGFQLFNGLGVEVDRERAVELLGQSAKQDWTLGRYNYAAARLMGAHEAISEEEARYLLERAAQTGMFVAQLVLDGTQEPRLILDGEDLKLAEGWGQKGDARREYSMAQRAERGWLVERAKSEVKLLKQYRSAAKAGYHRAHARLGEAYERGGLGLEVDAKRALGHFEAAVTSDNLDSLFRLGYLLDGGRGEVAADYGRAASLYERAVKMGSGAAANNLGNLYFAGKGVAKDLDRAMELYHLSAEMDGDPVACFNIGNKMLKGNGVARDEEKGLEWLARSGEKGYMRAIKALVEHYTPKSEKDGFFEMAYWTEKGAEEGDYPLMKKAALYYFNGIGVPKSQFKAWHWAASYLQSYHTGNVAFSLNVLENEPREAIAMYLPVDYEAMLIAVELLMDDSWTGYNIDQAFELAETFAKTKLFKGRLLLAKLHLTPGLKGGKPKEGLKLYEKVYEEALGEPRFVAHGARAAFELSRVYAKGETVPASDAKRAEWMRRSADLGVASSKYHYALFLIGGIGVEVDEAAGKAILLELARKGYRRAVVRLGGYLEAGELEEERAMLVEQLRPAAESGDKRAQEIMRKIGEAFEAPEPERRREDGEEKPESGPYRGVMG